MASAKLALPRSPWSRVYRRIVRALQADPTLNRVVKTWQARTGDAKEPKVIALGMLPSISLAPSIGSERWYGPSGFLGPLTIKVQIGVPGNDADDPMDIYLAVHRALYPTDEARKATIHRELVEAGAEGEYLLEFTSPNFESWTDGAEAWFTATGAMRINVKVDTNP